MFWNNFALTPLMREMHRSVTGKTKPLMDFIITCSKCSQFQSFRGQAYILVVVALLCLGEGGRNNFFSGRVSPHLNFLFFLFGPDLYKYTYPPPYKLLVDMGLSCHLFFLVELFSSILKIKLVRVHKHAISVSRFV